MTNVSFSRMRLDQVEMADRLGYDYAWEVSITSSRNTRILRALGIPRAQPASGPRTSRLGNGIIQLTTNHPARVAEKVACLDLMNNGRVEFGMGEGGSITEIGPFDRQMEDKWEVWEDAVRCVMPMFRDGGCQYDGPYFKFSLRNVLPKPVQKPHPPLSVACSQLEDD